MQTLELALIIKKYIKVIAILPF